MFRGFDVILKGRHPVDALWLTSILCGVCSLAHTMASVKALDMSLHASPPPLANAFRILGEATDMIYDHTLHLFNLAGPDYSELAFKISYPKVLEVAKEVKPEHADIHGYSKMVDLLKDLNPIIGGLYLKAVEYGKLAREAECTFVGKIPHSSTLIPGGISVTPNTYDVTSYTYKVLKLIDWVKIVVAVIEDLISFIYSEMPEYEDVGVREASLLSYGMYDPIHDYDGKYENIDNWGSKRLCSPGVVINNELVTTRLSEINCGVEEYVKHSWYEDWGGPEIAHDPLGNAITKNHPWNKDTKPKPKAKSWSEKYSWATSPRWKGHVVEVGPLARMWVTAKAGLVNLELVKATRGTVEITLPKSMMPSMSFTWKIPPKPNTLERLRARAYFLAYSAAVNYMVLLETLELLKSGEVKVWNEYHIPNESIGVGTTEAARGALAHWIVIKGGKIHRYQVITPTNWNVSPRDVKDKPGPIEASIIDTPILEEPNNIKGMEVVRTVRSFDPCIACTVHVYTPKENIKLNVAPEVNTLRWAK